VGTKRPLYRKALEGGNLGGKKEDGCMGTSGE